MEKNYCVDGECTADVFEDCRFYEFGIGCLYWRDCKRLDECTSKKANAEYEKYQK